MTYHTFIHSTWCRILSINRQIHEASFQDAKPMAYRNVKGAKSVNWGLFEAAGKGSLGISTI